MRAIIVIRIDNAMTEYIFLVDKEQASAVFVKKNLMLNHL